MLAYFTHQRNILPTSTVDYWWPSSFHHRLWLYFKVFISTKNDKRICWHTSITTIQQASIYK